jgi:hypothetical protein
MREYLSATISRDNAYGWGKRESEPELSADAGYFCCGGELFPFPCPIKEVQDDGTSENNTSMKCDCLCGVALLI